MCNYINKKTPSILMNAFITYKDERNISLGELLKKDKPVSIHQRNLQILATDIWKTRNDLGPEIMKDIFHSVQKPYNLRNDSTLQRRRNRTVYYGTESISSLAPQIWEIIPCEIKNAKSLDIFLRKIRL